MKEKRNEILKEVLINHQRYLIEIIPLARHCKAENQT